MNDSNKPDRNNDEIFALLSLVLGIVCVVSMLMLMFFRFILFHNHEIFVYFPSTLVSLIGLIFGRLMTKERKTLAKWGIGLCSIGLFLSVLWWFSANLIVPW
jgi:hypothetical protein